MLDKMATILAYGAPALGHLLPVSSLLRELAGRGHDIHLRTMATQVDAGTAMGFRTAAVDPAIEAIHSRDWTARTVFGVLRMTIDVLCRRAEFEVGDLAAAIAEVRPDALIIDANCWGAMSAADAGDLPAPRRRLHVRNAGTRLDTVRLSLHGSPEELDARVGVMVTELLLGVRSA